MKRIVSIVVTALLAGSLAFYVGVKYSQSAGTAGVMAGTGIMRSRDASGTAGLRGGGGVGGQIVAADKDSITVKTTDGSTKIVYLASTTRVTSSAEATLSDLAKGVTVVATGGSGEESGTITARNIQIVPTGSSLAFPGGGAGMAPQTAPQE